MLLIFGLGITGFPLDFHSFQFDALHHKEMMILSKEYIFLNRNKNYIFS